jgi:monoamine oxidase
MTIEPASRKRIGIIGGGPGGLMTAYLLEKRCKIPCDITIFEADSRVGGKIVTREFSVAPIRYEAGAAELYDYSHLGSDPLRELVAELGLSVTSMAGETVVIDDRILRSSSDIRRELGDHACRALKDFNRQARAAISPAEYYASDWQSDNRNPLASQTFHDLLAKVDDEAARRLIEVRIHSDLATEPYLTNAMYGLQNYLMDEPDYLRLYSINGGIDLLPRKLANRIKARIQLSHTVTRVEKLPQGSYRIYSRVHSEIRRDDFDYVVVALPNNWIPSVNWGGGLLADAMYRHHVFYDYPAHYLRVSVLFQQPFWRDQIAESYFMLDAFGGCCVYDEGSRSSTGDYGVLSWLLAGEPAMAMNNSADSALIEAVLDSLPRSLRHGRRQFLEGRVHRWVGTVDGLPGGFPEREPESCHQPEPVEHPELFVVGDYLFDSTINGVLDSAEIVADWICEDLEKPLDPAAIIATDQEQTPVPSAK